MSSPVCLPDLPQLICVDNSDHEDVGSACFRVDAQSELDQSMPAIFFDPVSDDCLTSTQLPVLFTGLAENAKDSVAKDDLELCALFSMDNADSLVESEEEVACFDLVSSGNEGEPILSSQPRYNRKEMWW